MTTTEEPVDVLVVGAGNAALCAALAARDEGATVAVLEAAPPALRGGNSAFTGGGMRFVYRGLEDIERLVPDLTEHDRSSTDFGAYTAQQFFDDIAKVTEHRADPDLAEALVDDSFPALLWLREKGIRFLPIYGRQAFNVDGRFRFWGGLTLETRGGGPGLVDALFDAAHHAGTRVHYATRAIRLTGEGVVTGVQALREGNLVEFPAKRVVLASGGFQANSEWRTRYLGPGWDLAKVRGTRFNTGDGIRMALEIGASSAGNWSGCHAVGWDRNAPEFGDLAVGDGYQKHSYPFGILVNARGERFVDEGADFRNYTYAKYGRRILEQPGQFAWQVFDKQVATLLRDEYRIRTVSKVTAQTLPELAGKLEGVDPEGFLATVETYNAAVSDERPFDPNVKDGRRTNGLAVPKSNWANRLVEPPFEAYAVTCGITFTFGGLRITPEAAVVDASGAEIPGLYACGELVGGLFYFNYPGGSGLTAGTVFGRRAGRNAAQQALASS